MHEKWRVCSIALKTLRSSFHVASAYVSSREWARRIYCFLENLEEEKLCPSSPNFATKKRWGQTQSHHNYDTIQSKNNLVKKKNP